MSDDPATPAVDPVDPPVAAAPPVVEPGKDGTPFDAERAQRTIEALRTEVKAAKADAKRVTDLEAQLKALEDANLSEQEKVIKERDALKAERDQWESERRELSLRVAVVGKATDLSIADTDLALAALDRSKITYTTTGEPENLTEVLTELLDSKPLLRGQAPATRKPDLNSGDGAGNQPPPSLTADELQAADNLGKKPEEYAAWKGVTSLEDAQALIESRKTGA